MSRSRSVDWDARIKVDCNSRELRPITRVATNVTWDCSGCVSNSARQIVQFNSIVGITFDIRYFSSRLSECQNPLFCSTCVEETYIDGRCRGSYHGKNTQREQLHDKIVRAFVISSQCFRSDNSLFQNASISQDQHDPSQAYIDHKNLIINHTNIPCYCTCT